MRSLLAALSLVWFAGSVELHCRYSLASVAFFFETICLTFLVQYSVCSAFCIEGNISWYHTWTLITRHTACLCVYVYASLNRPISRSPYKTWHIKRNQAAWGNVICRYPTSISNKSYALMKGTFCSSVHHGSSLLRCQMRPQRRLHSRRPGCGSLCTHRSCANE